MKEEIIISAREPSSLWPLLNGANDFLPYLFGKPLVQKKESLKSNLPVLQYPWELLLVLDTLFQSQDSQQIIASSAKIGQGTVIEGPVYIGENCTIGPYNVLRGPLNLEKGVKTGAFCELKHSIIQEGTHFHSGYVGDSVIAKNCRFAGGFVVANRRLDRKNIKTTVGGKRTDTGLTRLGAVVGNNTKVGIQVGVMPGVLIGSDCVIGPGTQVFENLEDSAVLYAKTQQIKKKRA